MNKKWFAGILFLCMTAAFPAAAADEAGYEEKSVKVIREGEEDGELVLRFYEEMPHIPYMGVNEYSQYMRQQPLTLREEDGMVILENYIGEEMQCCTGTGVITIEDWNRFFDLPFPLENEAKGWKDTSTRFVRITAVDYQGEPEPVVLDFAKYGIQVFADQDDIYLPVSVLSNIMTDVATNHLLFNGEKLYAQRVSLQGRAPEGFWDSELFQAQFRGEKRPDDIVKQCYADLCFNFDYFFGHPGIAVLDADIAEKGLDQALTGYGSEGKAIREGLLSDKLTEYVSAMTRLFMLLLNDGHTTFMSGVSLNLEKDYMSNQSFLESLDPLFSMLQSPNAMRQLLNMAIPVQRKAAWGEKTYRESGSTAIIRLDSFMPDEDAWNSYYNGEGDFPQDCLGIVISGLRKASENPDIVNVIFDLSCNSGGSPDVMMAILAVTTGQNQLYGIHKITGQKMIFTFEADTNFDGTYDEKDKEVRYDYNYGVLTTRYAFSCGNLFPIITQEAGMVLIGEPTSGGSCCIQVGSDAQGFSYLMSSAQWQLTDSQYNSVEGGCSIDLPVEAKSNELIDKLISIIGVEDGAPSFAEYFEDERLDSMMNEWFGDGEAELEIAA